MTDLEPLQAFLLELTDNLHQTGPVTFGPLLGQRMQKDLQLLHNLCTTIVLQTPQIDVLQKHFERDIDSNIREFKKIEDIKEHFVADGCLIVFLAIGVMNFKDKMQDDWIQFVNDFEDTYFNCKENIPRKFLTALEGLKEFIAKNVVNGDRSVILRTKDLLIQFPRSMEQSAKSIRAATLEYLDLSELDRRTEEGMRQTNERLELLHKIYTDFRNTFARFVEEIQHLFGILQHLLQKIHNLITISLEKTVLGKTSTRMFQEHITSLQMFIELSQERIDNIFNVPTSLRCVMAEPELVTNIREDMNAVKKKFELRTFKLKMDTILNLLKADCSLFNLDTLSTTIEQIKKTDTILHHDLLDLDHVEGKLELLQASLKHTNKVPDITHLFESPTKKGLKLF
jgi:hypothetical protein